MSDSDDIIYNDDDSSLDPNDSENDNDHIILDDDSYGDGVEEANHDEIQSSPLKKDNNEDEAMNLNNEEMNKEIEENKERIEGEGQNMINNQNTLKSKISLPERVSKEEFDVVKDNNSLMNIAPSPIKKKETADEMSMNIELKNHNEFIDMDHFDEASRIGFGLLDEQIAKEKKRIKILNLLSHEPVRELLGESSKPQTPRESPYKKLMKHYDNNPVLDFPFLKENKQIILYHQLKDLNTFNKYLHHKVNHYVKDNKPIEANENDNPNNHNDHRKMKNAHKREDKQQKHSNDIFTQANNYYNNNNSKPPRQDKPYRFKKSKHNAPIQSIPRDSHTNQQEEPLIDPASNTEVRNRRIIKENATLKAKFNELNAIFLELQSEHNKRDQELLRKNEKLSSYLDKYDSLAQENEILIQRVENKQIDYNIEKNESQKKSHKINELQVKLSSIEQDHREVLKKQEFESTVQKETKQSYESYKNNYSEMKSQYDLLSIKYQTLSDENFNYKRDVLVIEKEIKNKNDMIDKLRNSIIENTKYSINPINTTSLDDIDIQLNDKTGSPIKTRLNHFINNNIEKGTNGAGDNAVITIGNDNSNSNKSNLSKVEQMKLLGNQITKLNQDRINITNDLNKLPEHLRKKELIDKRKAMEDKIEQINGELSKLHMEMKTLKTPIDD